MNITPAAVAATLARKAAVKAAAAEAPRLAWTTSTGDLPLPAYVPAPREIVDPWADEEFCFVCGRCTDHVGEHDNLVEAGMARYEGGYVLKTDTYDVDERIRLDDEEVARLLAA